MDKAVLVEGLVKDFDVKQKKQGLINSFRSLVTSESKKVTAVNNISFQLEKGELVGFIGANGAGKTTTMKILSGLLYPTKGVVQVIGYRPWDREHAFLKNIALVMGQKNQLWWDLPATETFILNKEIYEIKDKEYKHTLNELVELLEVSEFLDTQVRRLSLGQRMRLELVASLLHSPEVLFLDEPTLGLDVVAQGKLRDFILEYNKKREATIMLTSHDMDDVVNLAKRVIVIDKGELIFDGKIAELTKLFAKKKRLHIYLADADNIKKFEEIGEVEKIDFPQVTLTVKREVAASAAAEILQSFPVVDLNIEEESLEDIVKRIFAGEKIDE